MKFKSVKTKRKPLNNRFLSAVLGISFAFAPVPYMLSSASIPVSADSSFISNYDPYNPDKSYGWLFDSHYYHDRINYYIDLYNTAVANADTALSELYFDCVKAICSETAAADYYYTSCVFNSFADSVPASDLVFGWFTTYDDNAIHTCTIYNYGTTALEITNANLPLWSSDLGTCYMKMVDTGVTQYVKCRTGQHLNYTFCDVNGSTNSFTKGSQILINNDSVSSSPLADYFSVNVSLTGVNAFYLRLIVNDSTASTFPSRSLVGSYGDFQPITFSVDEHPVDSPSDFIPSVVTKLKTIYPNVPDDVYIIPDTPYEPVYPTDFVTGIPKEWTVENPQLPTAANLEFDHYEEDLTVFHPIQEIKETVDIIKAMDFWWWLTEKTLDSLNLKIFYVIFLTVGVLIFIVWIIGQ